MKQVQNYTLPALPATADTLSIHFYTQFMHEFQRQRNADPYFRIYAAIESTAKKSGNAPDVVARSLVESGLRASKESFPGSFVATIEQSSAEPTWHISAATPQQRELAASWGIVPASGYKRARRYH